MTYQSEVGSARAVPRVALDRSAANFHASTSTNIPSNAFASLFQARLKEHHLESLTEIFLIGICGAWQTRLMTGLLRRHYPRAGIRLMTRAEVIHQLPDGAYSEAVPLRWQSGSFAEVRRLIQRVRQRPMRTVFVLVNEAQHFNVGWSLLLRLMGIRQVVLIILKEEFAWRGVNLSMGTLLRNGMAFLCGRLPRVVLFIVEILFLVLCCALRVVIVVVASLVKGVSHRIQLRSQLGAVWEFATRFLAHCRASFFFGETWRRGGGVAELLTIWDFLWQGKQSVAALKNKLCPRILVLRIDRLGDVVQTVPLLRILRRNLPLARIAVTVQVPYQDVLKDCPYVDEILPYPAAPPINQNALLGTARKVVESAMLLSALRRRRFDVCIDPVGRDESYRLQYLSGAKLRLTTDKERPGFQWNNVVVSEDATRVLESQRLLRLVAPLGISAGESRCELWVSEQERAHARHWLAAQIREPQQIIVACCPGSQWVQKRWPINDFASVTQECLIRFPATVLLFLGPEEHVLAVPFEAMGLFQRGVVPVVGKSLREIMALLSLCNAVVANDSGLLHMADALNIPSVAIFGPGDPRRWSPQTTGSHVISLGLECSPCIESYCPENICLTHLRVNHVWESLEQLLNTAAIT